MEITIRLSLEYGSPESEIRADSNQAVLESVSEPSNVRYSLGSTTMRWDNADEVTAATLIALEAAIAEYPILRDDDYSRRVSDALAEHARESGLSRDGLQWVADYYGLDRALTVTDTGEMDGLLIAAYGMIPDEL